MDRSRPTALPILEERREFLQKCASALAGVTLVGFVSPILSGCEPTSLPTPAPRTGNDGNTGNNGNGGGNSPEGVAFDVSILDADGKSVATDIKGSDGFAILIVRNSATSYTALSMRCTHQSCAVDKSVPVGGPIICRCHGSRFRLDGSVLQGPAASPLASYVTTFDEATKIVRIKTS
jgi:Rieske Fe-S protein